MSKKIVKYCKVVSAPSVIGPSGHMSHLLCDKLGKTFRVHVSSAKRRNVGDVIKVTKIDDTTYAWDEIGFSDVQELEHKIAADTLAEIWTTPQFGPHEKISDPPE